MNKALILIVEDEEIVAADLVCKLSQCGYQIAGMTGDGKEAIALARQLRPDLVLMDIHLAGRLDGIQAAAIIRQECNLPVIYLTAHSDQATLQRAKLTEPFGYILKPFEERELVSHIEMALYRHQAETELRQNREWLRVTLNSIGDAVVACDTEYRVTFLNPMASTLTGWTAAEVLGQPVQRVLNIIHEHTRQPIEDLCVRVIKERAPIALANHSAILTKDGREIAIEDSAAPILDAQGAITGVVVVFHDVTEKRQARDSLRESEARFRALFDYSPDAVFLTVPEGRIAAANPSALAMFGMTEQEICQIEWQGIIDTSDSQYLPLAEELQRAGCIINKAMAFIRKNGQRFEGETTSVVLPGEERKAFVIIRDITERKLAQDQIQANSARLAAVLEAQRQIASASLDYPALLQLSLNCVSSLVGADGASIEIDQAGEMVYEAATGLAAGFVGLRLKKTGSLSGRCMTTGEVLRADDTETDPRVDREACRRIGLRSMTVIPLRYDERSFGVLKVMSARVSAFDGVAEHTLRLMGEFLGVTLGRQRAQEALRQSEKAAEAANQAKSQFLASMSHELRTPMNAILGMTDLALSFALPAQARDFLQTSKESANQLLEILNEILDFSRIEAGRFELDFAAFNLPELIELTVRALGVRACEKGLELVYDLDDNLPAQVKGDPLRLRQVLTNLVGNAIKFTPKGEIVIHSQLERQDGDQVHLRFAVRDTGIGISPENLEKIFAPFTQADASTTRHYGGSGLGLTISQRLVQMMGGRIWAESQLGQGSTFFFTVVLNRSEDVLPAKAQWSLPLQEALRDLPILVVAQNSSLQRMLHQMLSSWSMRPEVVADVPSALTKIHQAAALGQPFRLVLADAVLPNVSGFTLADWLGKDTKLAGPVILLVSATDRMQHPDQSSASTRVLVDKPVSRSGLFNAITQSLGLQAEPNALNSSGPVLLAQPAQPLRILLAEDTPANQKLVQHVLGERGHHLTIAQNGLEALRCLEQDSFDLVLMDVQMPELDGFEAARQIRRLSDPAKALLPIIALTAHAMKGDKEKCLAAGMTNYLSKPINAREMIQMVEQSAQSASVASPLVRPATPPLLGAFNPSNPPSPAPSGSEVPPMGFDLQEAMKCCYGQYKIFHDMVGCFYTETEGLLEQLQNAIERRDASEVARLAHRMLNTIAYLGCSEVTQNLRRLEQLGRQNDLSQVHEAAGKLGRQIEGMRQILSSYRQNQ